MTLRDVVICEPIRTPIGRYGGTFKSVSACRPRRRGTLRAPRSHRHRPDRIDDVILGHCYPNSEAPAMGASWASMRGSPRPSGGSRLDRRCGSGLQAIINAVMQVGSGASDVVVAGGSSR